MAVSDLLQRPTGMSAVTIAALLLSAGTACGITFGLDARSLTWLLLPGLVIALLVGRLASKSAVSIAIAVLVWLVGLVGGARAREEALETSLRLTLDRVYGHFTLESLEPEGRHEPMTTRLRLEEDASPLGDVVVLRGSAMAVLVGGVWHPLEGDGVRLTVAGGTASRRSSEWRAGRTIVAPVVFRRPSRYLNEGVPDLERALALDGISLLGTVKSGLLVQVETRGSAIAEGAANIRAHVRRVVSRTMGARDPTSAGITTAVLIGDRTGLADSVRTRLQQAGVYHVIAISGGNIAILAGIVLTLLALLGVRGRHAAAITLVFVVSYAFVVTAGPSVWRATLMAVLALAARTLDHRTPARHAVAVAAFVMLIARPLDVRDPGFMLTFGATVALVEVASRMRATIQRPSTHDAHTHWIVRMVSGGWKVWVLPSLVASAAVELALMPVSAQAFSRVTIAGLVLNLAAVPLMALVQTAGVVLVIADRWAIVAEAAAAVGSWSATAILQTARLVELAPWLTWRVPPPGIVLLAVYYGSLVAVLSHHRRLRQVGAAVLASAALAIACGAPTAFAGHGRSATLRLTVFDVGQAESMLLEVPGGGSMIVDAGGAAFGSPGFAIGARVLAPALWSRGVRSIDTLIVTHGDPDHVGGAGALIDDFAPVRLLTGIDVPGHDPTRTLAAHARQQGVALASLRTGEVLRLGKAQLRVLHPPQPDWERQRVRNDDSVVLEVLYGDVALLLTGDIGEDVERAILPQLSPARRRVLKVAHHGSRTSTSRELLQAWKPELAVISCGRGNSFGHPAPEVIERLNEAGVRILRTDRDGQITIETDGHDVSSTTFRATKGTKR